jgi:hypothetical protein
MDLLLPLLAAERTVEAVAAVVVAVEAAAQVELGFVLGASSSMELSRWWEANYPNPNTQQGGREERKRLLEPPFLNSLLGISPESSFFIPRFW